MAKLLPAKVTFDYVDQEKLRFDPSNPRFTVADKAPTQEQIQLRLEREPHLAVELIPSFLENGFIPYEPLVVRQENDLYIVVEGNRRLAAIRHILANRSDYEAKSTHLNDLLKIPVLIFPPGQPGKEQRVYLGVRHLFGFREWPPESKARYLDSQIATAADLERVMRELNIKRQDIQRYLVPYRLRKKAAEIWKPHKDDDFWVLGEGLNRSGVKEYIELDVERTSMKVVAYSAPKLAKLFTFIYGEPPARDGRIVKETRQLSELGALLKNKRAVKALEAGSSLADATVLAESVDETMRRLKKLVKDCRLVVNRFKSKNDAADVVKSFRAFEAAATDFLRKRK